MRILRSTTRTAPPQPASETDRSAAPAASPSAPEPVDQTRRPHSRMRPKWAEKLQQRFAHSHRQGRAAPALSNISDTLSTNSSRAQEFLPTLSDEEHLALRIFVGSTSAASATDPAQTSPSNEQNGHHAGLLDLDEAAHGGNGAVNYGQQAAEKGGSEVMRQLQKEAQEWQDHPVQALSNTVAPQGVADFVVSLSAGAVVAPFAVIAIKAGLEEIKEAKENKAELQAQQQHVNALKLGLQAMLNASDDPALFERLTDQLVQALKGSRFLNQQQSTELAFALQQNKRGGQFGLASAVSGSAILASVGLKVGAQLSLVGAAGGHIAKASTVAIGSAAATGAVAGVAAASAAASLVAGGAALYLGDRAVRKSGKRRRKLQKNTVPTRAYLAAVKQALGSDEALAQHQHYAHFFNTKSAQRENFYKHYHRLNKTFENGAAIYTASAAGKLLLIVTAAAGIAALAEPVTLAAVITAGTIGGITMAVGSSAFLTGHGKDHRYESYALGDAILLERDFLATLDVLLPEQENAGVEMRAHTYETLLAIENQRQDFLQQVALQCGKYQKRHAYSTEPPDSTDTPSGQHKSVLKKVWSGPRALSTLAYQMGRHLSVSHAKESAHKMHAAKSARLTQHRLSEWINAPENFAQQIDHMRSQLQKSHACLAHKIVLREAIFPGGASAGVIGKPSSPTENNEAQQTLEKFLHQQDSANMRDKSLEAQMRLLSDGLSVVQNTPQNPDQAQANMALARERFMCLQVGARYDTQKTTADPATSGQEFAKFLQEYAPKQHQQMRGILVETEMQAYRLRCLAADVNAQTAVPDHGYQPDPLRKSGAGHAAYLPDPARPAPPPWDDFF
jgi:hypothetical protein